MYSSVINTLRPRQNGRHFGADIFKCILLNENVWISLKISLKFAPKVRIYNITALVHIMAWRRPGDMPLSGPMMVILLTHIYMCVTRPHKDGRRPPRPLLQHHHMICDSISWQNIHTCIMCMVELNPGNWTLSEHAASNKYVYTGVTVWPVTGTKKAPKTRFKSTQLWTPFHWYSSGTFDIERISTNFGRKK